MENQTPVESKPAGYKVLSIILLESTFQRVTDIDINIGNNIDNEIGIETIPHENNAEGKFAVTLMINYKGLQNQQPICTSSIKMIGIFEKYGEPILSEEKFKAINAPAIIYPFIREHLHNICLKASIANILLPTVNFKP